MASGESNFFESESMSVKPCLGVIRGKTIVLVEDLGLVEGQEIEVVVRIRTPEMEWGRGIRKSAGGMIPHWTAEDDQILEAIENDRRRPSTRELPE